ncbi:MAG: hypothetical protein H8Z69_02850 [Nanohaloarchaea archaeon]|nr:hypothetical protein [Candidatus Nanohaloarchaea archaeon]
MIKDYLFELTPLGKADKEVKDFLEDKLDGKELERYERSLAYYRNFKLIQSFLRALLYASIITSVAATFGLPQAKILQRMASYLGTTLIIVLYGVVSYITMIRRESYHVQREILISKARD